MTSFTVVSSSTDKTVSFIFILTLSFDHELTAGDSLHLTTAPDVAG